MPKASSSSNNNKKEGKETKPRVPKLNEQYEEFIRILYEEIKENEKLLKKFKEVSLNNDVLFDKLKQEFDSSKKEIKKKEKKIEKQKKEISNLTEVNSKLKGDIKEKDKTISNLTEINQTLIISNENSNRLIEELNRKIAILEDKLKNSENDNSNNNNNNDDDKKKDEDNKLNDAENKDDSIQSIYLNKCGLSILEQCDHENFDDCGNSSGSKNSSGSESSSHEEDNTSVDLAMIQLECGCYFHIDCLNTFKTIYKLKMGKEPERNYCPVCNLDKAF
ncbi:hypothetical protein LY90DRAFT_506738 [Neocallimastix californiae]|jgi:DNA repair exonuclease SbcCD ATPase subunit|uniref:Uncharacterized protein n=1 Tax=Neocallimastix californiae TaxID=1754190 RepID=A0A1Y2DBJ2_9FUNG|nr:hypothetical protein LY90DRAFT_506738 [Neocallimastix californiae]|eukprot:ORY56486.1 hypothetical protein LY90DRAFT_506738 [Neocallimastix californiae]